MNFNVKEIIFKENTEVDEKEETIKIIEHMSKIVINKSSFLFADILYKIYIILAGIFIINSNIFDGRSNDKFTTMLLIIGLCFIIQLFVDYVINITEDTNKGLVIIYVTISMFLIGTAVIAPIADVKITLFMLFIYYFICNGIFYLIKRTQNSKKAKESISIVNEAGVNNVELRLIENTENNLSIILSIRNMTTNKESYGKMLKISDIGVIIDDNTVCMIIDNKEGFKAVLKINKEQLKRINEFVYDMNNKLLDEMSTIDLYKTFQPPLHTPVKIVRIAGLVSFIIAEDRELVELDKELNSHTDKLKEVIDERETLEV